MQHAKSFKETKDLKGLEKKNIKLCVTILC